MAVRKAMGLPTVRQPSAPPAKAAAGEQAAAKPTYRTGREQFGGWIPSEAKEQIDVWRARNRWTQQQVLEHALNLFFAEQKLQRIASRG